MDAHAETPDRILERYRQYLGILARVQLDPQLQGKIDLSGVVQQTLLEAYQALPDFEQRGPAQTAAWLRRILANNLGDEIPQARRRQARPGAGTIAGSGPGRLVVPPGRMAGRRPVLAQPAGRARGTGPGAGRRAGRAPRGAARSPGAAALARLDPGPDRRPHAAQPRRRRRFDQARLAAATVPFAETRVMDPPFT